MSSAPADREALALVVRTLARYPSPAPAPGRALGPVRYVPPIELAMALYCAHFQRTGEEATIGAAFAAVAPKVLGRCRALEGALLEAIADGAPRPAGARADYMSLLGELSALACVFASPAGPAGPAGAASGPFRPQYTAVCEMITALMSAATGWGGPF